MPFELKTSSGIVSLFWNNWAMHRFCELNGIVEVNRLLLDAGLVVVNAFISPYRADREQARGILPAGDFSEVFVKADIAVCEQRDVKGLYAKARAGELEQFTGVSSPYEEPVDPELVVATDHQTIEQSLELLWDYVLRRIR
ncbi:MAG: adenylyl-sulfate kinase, partial [Bacteroidota bacterium]